MILELIDPADESVRGGMSNPDVVPESVLGGGFFDLELSDTLSSESVTTLFDLHEPPSFHGPFMVTATLNDQGALDLFLATSTGDTTHAFATLDGFRDVATSGQTTGSGSGSLTRANKLPIEVNWAVSP
jgi:hypothetical protein